MRVERKYTLSPDGAVREQEPARREYWIEVTETYYCQDATCEATHDDPSALWDSRVSRILALAKHHDAERVIKALRLLDAVEGRFNNWPASAVLEMLATSS